MTYSPRLLRLLGTDISHELLTNKPSEVRLFQAILVQAFEDALNPNPSKIETYQKIDAHNWFTYPDPVFEKICWLAGFDPEMITDRYKKLQATGQVTFTGLQKKWIKYRNLYKNYRSNKTSEEKREIMKKIKEIDF